MMSSHIFQLSGAEFVDYAMTREMKGMNKPLKPVPKFAQGKGETDYSFLTRVENAATQVINVAKFEDKYQVSLYIHTTSATTSLYSVTFLAI